jgi:hypothetical protein
MGVQMAGCDAMIITRDPTKCIDWNKMEAAVRAGHTLLDATVLHA